MTWDTRIVNNHSTDITVNDTNLGAGASVVLSGVHDVVVAVSSIGTVQLTEPGADDFHQYISTTWAVKVVASGNAYVRYWGYEGRPTLVLTINEDDTFTLPDQNNTSFDHIPISRPPLAQYAGQYDTNTHWWGGFFSPFIINQDGTVSVGPSGLSGRLQVQYDSKRATVSLDWTKFKDTSFKTSFSLTGTGQNISLAGDLNPRPQDGGVQFTGSLSSNQADAFHLLVLKYEFPLYFDSAGRRPLSFRGPGALACNTNNSPSSLDFFRLAPLDVMDRTKGYRLWCNGFYAGTADTMWQGDRCISGTTDTSTAIVFKPNLTSSKLFKLGAPDYISPWPRNPPLTSPVLASELDSGARTLIMNDAPGPWFSTLRVPPVFTARSIYDTGIRYLQCHYFFLAVDFPLMLTNGSSLQLSGGTFVTPDGDGSTLFRFTPLDENNYKQGYRVSSGGNYIAGVGTFQGRTCIKTTSNAQQADILKLRILPDSTFMVQNTTTLNVLSQPIDQTGHGQTNLDYELPGDRGVYSGVNQGFQLPTWSTRLMRMAYLPTSVEFSLAWPSNNKIIYAATASLSLAPGDSITNTASAVVSITPQDSSKAHSGYLMTVGGSKYVKYAGSGVSVSLVDDTSQATPLCIVRHADSTLSFWHCMSNHVLTSNDGNTIVFTELNDDALIEPSWSVTEPLQHSLPAPLRTTASVSELAATLDDTIHIKPIVSMLKRDLYGKKGSTWNVSFNNALASDWWIATPNHPFVNYADFEMPVKDDSATNDFKLKAQSPGDPVDPKHPAVALASSVTQPGGQPLVLHAGHSRLIYEQMYKVMISADKFVDVMSLIRRDATPSGQFLAAFRNAVTYLSKKPTAQDITVRILFGMPGGDWGKPGVISGTGPYQSAGDVLQELVRDVQSSRMKVYIGYTTSTLAWNHAKMIAVDGVKALVGGHNMWDGAYLWGNPVQDTSMILSGLAATDAHEFADCMWDAQMKRYWAPLPVTTMSDYEAPSYNSNIKSFSMPDRVTNSGFKAVPPAFAFAKVIGERKNDPNRTSGSGIPMVSVAREQNDFAGSAASDKALITLLDSASTSINISAQAMKNHYDFGDDWNEDFLKALSRALVRQVSIKLFMSDATNKGSYQGDPPGDVIGQIQNRIEGKTPQEIQALVTRLKVQSFPPSTFWGFSNGTPGCSNHAKVIVVDSRAASIGSQNYYPSSIAKMAEFTYIFEDVTKATQLINDYFTPLAAWCVAAGPPPALPSSAPPRYTVTIIGIYCEKISGGGLGRFSPDQVYLKGATGGKIWPTERFQVMRTDQAIWSLNVALPSFTASDNPATVAAYEWDWLSDDHLGDWEFKASDFQGKDVNSHYNMKGKMDSDTEASYYLYYTFQVT